MIFAHSGVFPAMRILHDPHSLFFEKRFLKLQDSGCQKATAPYKLAR